MDKPQRMTLEYLSRNDLPLYVRNTSRPCSTMLVNMRRPNSDKTKPLRIEREHIPLCITERFDWATIMASDDLRVFFHKGMLEILDPDEAEKELESSGVSEERKRVQYSRYSAKSTFVEKPASDNQTVDADLIANSGSVQPLGIETNVILPRVLSLVEKHKTGDVSNKKMLHELKILEADLRDTDCSYVIANGPDGQVRTWAQKLLAKLRNKPLDEYDVRDDGAPNMTPEEQARESQREALARQFQRV